MQLLDSYTVVNTESLSECRDFYRHFFGFEPVFESSWFVLMSSGGDRPVSIAFMHPEHPSSPPDPAAHRGDGSFLTLISCGELSRVRSLGRRCISCRRVAASLMP